MRQAGVRGAQPGRAEGIVTARIQDHEIEFGPRAFHLSQHQLGVDHLEIQVLNPGRIGIQRHQPVGALNLHTVPRVIEQRDFRPSDILPEGSHRGVKTSFVEIDPRAAPNKLKTQRLERLSDQRRVVPRVRKWGHISVRAVAHDQCNPASLRGRHVHTHQEKYGDQNQAGRGQGALTKSIEHIASPGRQAPAPVTAR